MSAPPPKIPGALFSFAVFGFLPFALLLVIVVASGDAQIVLDHEILGRNAAGMPVLQTLPLLRGAINLWNLALVYVLPAALAAWFAVWGARRGVRRGWIVSGAALVCVIGSVHRIQTVWTGIKGTSQLAIGIETHPALMLLRLAFNLAILAAAFWLARRKRASA
jgi:hypothetical protein